MEPTVRADVYRLVRDRKMLEAVKFLRAQGLDLHASKEYVEAVFMEVAPDEALSRESGFDALVRELEMKKK